MTTLNAKMKKVEDLHRRLIQSEKNSENIEKLLRIAMTELDNERALIDKRIAAIGKEPEGQNVK